MANNGKDNTMSGKQKQLELVKKIITDVQELYAAELRKQAMHNNEGTRNKQHLNGRDGCDTHQTVAHGLPSTQHFADGRPHQGAYVHASSHHNNANPTLINNRHPSPEYSSPYSPRVAHDNVLSANEPLKVQSAQPSTNIASPERPPVPALGSLTPNLKRKRSGVIGNYANNRCLRAEFDPENHEIYRLRQKEDMDFDAIAQTLNNRRIEKGQKANMSTSAVMSRYKRNAALIASILGEEFTPTKKDAKYKGIIQARGEDVQGFDAREDALLAQAYGQVYEEFWGNVSERMEELGGGYHEPALCARRHAHL